MKTEAIRFIGDLQRVDVRPGDKFVVRVPFEIDDETATRIKKACEDFFGGAPVLVLSSNMKLGVIGAANG